MERGDKEGGRTRGVTKAVELGRKMKVFVGGGGSGACLGLVF